MNDGLIGLIILIAILNIVGRIIKGFSRAAQQQKEAPRQGPGLAELLEKLSAAAEKESEPAAEEPDVSRSEEPFSWLREEGEEERKIISPAPASVMEDDEFLPQPDVEYALDDRLVVEPVPIYTGEAAFESIPGMPLETAYEPPILTGPAIVERPPRGLDTLVDSRFTGLKRAIVYSEILRPCPSARRRSPIRRHA